MLVDMKVFYTFNMCATLRPCLYLVDNTVEGRNILEEKTREGVDIRMYHFSFNCLQLGCDMLWRWWLTSKSFFIFLTFVTTLRTCEEVDDTMGGKDKEEKTWEVANIWMYHFSWNLFNFDMICCGHDVWHHSLFYIFNIFQNIGHVSLSLKLWGRRHCGRQGELGGGVHGGR